MREKDLFKAKQELKLSKARQELEIPQKQAAFPLGVYFSSAKPKKDGMG